MLYETVEVEIDVSKLRIGMNVIKLDRPWEETDFLMQGFVIQSQKDIDALRSQCRKVIIEGKVKNPEDPIQPTEQIKRKEKANFIKFSERPGSRPQTSAKSQEAPEPQRGRITYINKVDLSHEIPSATGHYGEAKKVAEGIMSGLRMGQTLDINKAREVVNDCVDSILRNDDALLLLTKLKHKDKYTAEHSLNVSILSAVFGKRLGLPEEEIRTLGLAALLHDIGKAKVPEEILLKPGGLTPEENGIMQNHTNWGRDILMALPQAVHAAIDVAYSHHERPDGNGYPRGLLAYQIPYFAKIVAIVEAYDAITSNRAYEKGRSSMDALEIIHRFRGTQFDPDLAIEFVLMIGVYPPGSIVEMKTGEVAIVIASNPKNRRRPRVMVVRDKDRERPPKFRLLDLSVRPKNESGEAMEIAHEVPDGTYGVVLQKFIDRGLTFGY